MGIKEDAKDDDYIDELPDGGYEGNSKDRIAQLHKNLKQRAKYTKKNDELTVFDDIEKESGK